MGIADYRNICASVRDMAVHFHSCVDACERHLWAIRARAALHEGMQVECPLRTSQDDKQNMNAALVELQQLIRQVEAATRSVVSSNGVKTKSVTTRASAYNKSPGRAVRLGRAARSAMRCGYF